MTEKSSVRSIRMTDEIFFKMKIIAKLQKRSATKQIEQVLGEYINEFEQEHGPINLDESE